MTLAHAQTWALLATDEARNMFFTRASMSCAKCVRLVEMMGLHRLDGPEELMAPVIGPPASWTELEERRRTFWGAFCIDSHASISSGWPMLIDMTEVSRWTQPHSALSPAPLPPSRSPPSCQRQRMHLPRARRRAPAPSKTRSKGPSTLPLPASSSPPISSISY
jgi:hypothetical protein